MFSQSGIISIFSVKMSSEFLGPFSIFKTSNFSLNGSPLGTTGPESKLPCILDDISSFLECLKPGDFLTKSDDVSVEFPQLNFTENFRLFLIRLD